MRCTICTTVGDSYLPAASHAAAAVAEQAAEREVYFPQYNKIYVGLNDSNKTKRRVAGKAQGPSDI